MKGRLPALLALTLSAGLLGWAGVSVVHDRQPRATSTAGAARAELGRSATGAASPTGMAALQAQLRRVPEDWSGWATLGATYVQQARVSADPSYYPRAQAALERSLALRSVDNYQAMAGMGALAAARHDFAAALSWAQRASRINGYNASVYGVMSDALVELGRYPEAWQAIQRMVDLKPGLPAFARASYAAELQGNNGQAFAALQRALKDATAPADVAFVHYYLGELAWNSGDLSGAAAHYAAGTAADPTYLPLRQGRAKVAAARHQSAAAIGLYTALIARFPLPQYVIELGDLFSALGQRAEATRTYDLVRAEQRLLAANGVNTDLELALFDADHGDAAEALRAARAEWGRRHSVHVADALGWALHRLGRDREALPYAEAATHLGTRSALFDYHRGMIEKSLGQRQAASLDLSRALSVNPYFNAVQAPLARRALAELATGS